MPVKGPVHCDCLAMRGQPTRDYAATTMKPLMGLSGWRKGIFLFTAWLIPTYAGTRRHGALHG